MADPLKLLLIEDSEDDALLVVRALRQGGFAPEVERVQTAEAMGAALARGPWDAIIADHALPQFSATAALRLLQESRRDIPFIVVSGTIGERAAVELMRSGAADYVMKDSLGRLPEAVRREIRDAAVRVERRRAEAALQSLIEGTAAVTGLDFFEALVRQIARSLEVPYVLVDELAGEQLHSLAAWGVGRRAARPGAGLAGTPGEVVLREGRLRQASSLRAVFPHDPDLAAWGAESYLGVALYDSAGRAFGTLCILDTAALRSPESSEAILRLFAARASAELERQQATRALEQVNRELEQIVDQRTAELSAANLQLARTNIELARATRLKDQFLATMSHELRTPLNAILGLSESLQEEIYGPLSERQGRAVATIEQSGRHLLQLINDILDISKMTAGMLQLCPAPVVVGQLCEHSLLFVREQAVRKQIGLTSLIPPELAAQPILADELRLRQALINLLANAVKFTPEGGRVELAAELVAGQSPAERLRFHVVDTGIGIAAESLGTLFQPFVQIDSSLNRQHTGSGLGLALVKQIAELHGGGVSVESRPGEGSRFTIELPYIAGLADPGESPARAEEPAPAAPPAAASPPGLPPPLILLADDNEQNAAMLSAYLEAQQFRLGRAANGAEAYAFARSHAPDLILMDVQMPQMDGLEAIRLIRASPQLAHTPIIALTALATPADEARCLAAGANAYVRKPVRLRELLALVRSLLAGAL